MEGFSLVKRSTHLNEESLASVPRHSLLRVSERVRSFITSTSQALVLGKRKSQEARTFIRT